jgi:hypothetical protein
MMNKFEIEQDTSYWDRITHESQKKIEYEWRIKIWDFIEYTTTQCKLPSLGPPEILTRLIKYWVNLKVLSSRRRRFKA